MSIMEPPEAPKPRLTQLAERLVGAIQGTKRPPLDDIYDLLSLVEEDIQREGADTPSSKLQRLHRALLDARDGHPMTLENLGDLLHLVDEHDQREKAVPAKVSKPKTHSILSAAKAAGVSKKGAAYE